MTSLFDRFFIILALLYAVGFSSAIYDPKEATTKPPKRREPVLPWYLSGKDYVESHEDSDPSRSPKWGTDPDNPKPRNPVVINSESNAWSPWRKNPDSEIEQRTEVADDRQTEINFHLDRDRSLDFIQFEQRENQKFPSTTNEPQDSLRKKDRTQIFSNSFGGNVPPGEVENDPDLYEGLPTDITKPHKEKILHSKRPKSTVARYTSGSGVQCPDIDSSGQFVYPPDCKFFVNCWKGRAFVQPCAPGTLFNPDTLECDFPHKVKCYGGELADFPSNEHLDSTGRREPLLSGSYGHLELDKFQAPRCPPHVTGLVAHPADCTKFLQCANGGTIVMDCGPGTVFNPAVSVCDWPRNVRGCEDAIKSNEDGGSNPPLIPPDIHGSYNNEKSEYNEHPTAKKIACPPDYSGLLPHPETCKKFLQCANGVTYVMDCGPGTAFNPSLSVCDWPYNVPGCSEGSVHATTVKPWPSRGPTIPAPWANRHDQPSQTGHHKPVFWTPGGTTPIPNPPATDWESLRPTWRPSWKPNTWTTAIPPYNPDPHRQYGRTGYDNRNNYEKNEENQQREHGHWGPRENYPTSNHHHDHLSGQWPHGHADHNQGQHQHGGQNFEHDYHHPYHHPHHHSNGDETQQPFRPDVGETGQPGPSYNHPHYHGSRQGDRSDGNWQPPRSHHFGHEDNHQWSYPAPDYPKSPGESDSQATQNRYDDTVGNLPGNRRTGHELTPNRQEYGRTNLGYGNPLYDRTPAPDGNIYVDTDYKLPAKGSLNSTKRILPWSFEFNGTITSPENNRTTWSQPSIPGRSGFHPGTWTGQQGQGQLKPQSREWDQGTFNEGDKFHEWGSRPNINQYSTIDRQTNTKFDQWPSKTNTLPRVKGRPGMKSSVQDPTKSSYPNGIYVNVNGTKGHFITKDIEINQGYTRTKTSKPNDFQAASRLNRKEDNNYNGSQIVNSNRDQPSTDLQPPVYNPTDHSNGPSPGLRSPKYHSADSPSDSSKYDDLIAADSTNNRRAIAPPTNLQPPYHQLPRQSMIPHGFNQQSANSHYPPVPSTNLEPPNYEPPKYPEVPASNLQPPSYKPFQHPKIPANDLQPPNYKPLEYPEVPSSNLQPPYFKPSSRPLVSSISTHSPSLGTQYPSAPASHLLPPAYQFVTYSTDFSRPTESSDPESPSSTLRSTIQRIPDKQMILPFKKKVVHQTTTEASMITSTISTTDPNIPSVSIEYDDDAIQPKSDNFDVDMLDETKVWKPVLVFENRTKTTTESSVIMQINKKKTDVDLFNLEAAPFQEEEPPFPTYYVPPVAPITHAKETAISTPISGQMIRLRGGSGPHDGYVEVQGINPGWGTVCDYRNSWTLKEAHVVCRQLGYTRGAEMAWQGRNNLNGVPTWIGAKSVTCHGNETRFQSCKFTHDQDCRVERDAIGVRCTPNRLAHCRKDEISHEGQCYHLASPDSGLNHAEALEYCTQRQARLIDITSQLENDFVSEWLLQTHPEVGSIMTSGIGFTMLSRTVWVWEDSSRAKFRFNKWWPGWMADKKHPPIVGSRPLCVVMKRKFPCHERPDSICVADYFFWDAEDCAASMKGHSYICKRPYDDIGCVYGKGNQYAGNANVTTSGRDCLSWGDEKVAHPLGVIVVNRELRQKLKTHNYCRNPNPNTESRPWCFTGPSGEREYCDIPHCGNIDSKRALLTDQCKPKHFECLPGECIPSPWVCDGEEDCTNGADERACISHLGLYKKYSKHKLEGYDVEKWLNTPLKTCALRCKEADFTCRSFAHKSAGNMCLLSGSNIGMTGSLKPNKEFDYYEMNERSINCDGMYVCGNRKCINQTQVCNGKNDCNDRTDENICTVENLDYEIRLAGSNNNTEGRVEVKILGVWGQVCDDGFGMINADVICKELGFVLGALEVRPGGFYGNLDPPTRFMVDQLKCRGNETSLRECDFDGWGVHNCQPEEAVGVLCKTAVDSCQEGHWKCDNSPACIPIPFICDEVVDCPDNSDESPEHCDAPFEIRLANGSSTLQGRVEIRHHGVWGTVCDDDFSNITAAVICRSLGYGGKAVAKKDGFFGPGEGPIWLDEVYCNGNETQLHRCEHNYWGQHNCDHNEDAGVICTPGDVNDSELLWEKLPSLPEPSIDDLLPADCGKRFKDFNENEDLIFAKVVHGTIAPEGSYPWQASIRVRGHSRSSHWCGAVILSPLHVLTAAHCLEGYNKGTYFIRAGDYHTEIDEGTEAEANIEDYYVHEEFRKGHRMNNDIALILLKGRGIPLGKDIMPICLPAENTEYPPGLNCTISGFGSIETGKSKHSKQLRYGWVPLLDQSVCRAGYIYGEGAISDGMVCAGYLDEGIDTCDGDSGGPLACYHNGAFTLYGITSWGQHCGKANKPGVYVRVSYYRHWIEKKIQESLAGR